MPPKRKSEVLEPDIDLTSDKPDTESEGEDAPAAVAKPAAKKARKSDIGEGSWSGAKKGKAAADAPKPNWQDIVLDGEEEGNVKIYDDCNDIRRKIKALQKQPGFKITHWLKEIGNINNNSYQRFMRASGPTGGASNGTYYAAYVYFEKVRIAEGKKKTPKRLRNEQEHPNGFPRVEQRWMWVRG